MHYLCSYAWPCTMTLTYNEAFRSTSDTAPGKSQYPWFIMVLELHVPTAPQNCHLIIWIGGSTTQVLCLECSLRFTALVFTLVIAISELL